MPLVPAEGGELQGKHWDYLYEPDAKTLLDGLLVRYVESQVYQAVVENAASEQAARMIAMKNATEQTPAISSRSCSWSTTRLARLRSPKKFRKSSAAPPRSDGQLKHSRNAK